MGNFFKNNEFKTDYKKRPNDEYKAALEKLDDETKRKFDRRRTWILVGVVAAVFVLIMVLALTGIGTNKAESAGNILGRESATVINCLGDSVTEGVIVSESGEESVSDNAYPDVLSKELSEKLQKEIAVHNYGEREGLAENTSYKKMAEKADVAILLYGLENYLQDVDPEGVLEANVDGLSNQGTLVYLTNYPYASFAKEESAVRQANQNISKAAKAKNLLLLDAAAHFQGLLEQGYTEEDLFSADGIHLTETGYEKLGSFIAGGLIADAGLE